MCIHVQPQLPSPNIASASAAHICFALALSYNVKEIFELTLDKCKRGHPRHLLLMSQVVFPESSISFSDHRLFQNNFQFHMLMHT
jgi:hypothetical protein